MIGRIIFKKNFLYLQKKCPKLDLNQVNKVLNFFKNNNDNHFEVETSNLTNHSVIISSKID